MLLLNPCLLFVGVNWGGVHTGQTWNDVRLASSKVLRRVFKREPALHAVRTQWGIVVLAAVWEMQGSELLKLDSVNIC